MSLMCAKSDCRAQAGMCRHEKIFFIAALFAAAVFIVRHLH